MPGLECQPTFLHTIRPNGTATRAQAVKLLALAFGLPVSAAGGSLASPNSGFSDVRADSPYYPYIQAAYSRGWISGYGDGTFRPDNNITDMKRLLGELVKRDASLARSHVLARRRFENVLTYIRRPSSP